MQRRAAVPPPALIMAGLATLLAPRVAEATYSIVAADTRTHRTGGAGTSCLSGDDVFIIHGVVPKVGTLHAQSLFNANALTEGRRELAAGVAPDQIILNVTSPSFDRDFASRQFGIASVSGKTATFTGADDGAVAFDQQGAVGTLVYAVQGNLLTSRAVIDQAAGGFESAGCDLPERLMRALEAGAAHGEGDRRCTGPRGIPSDSAFLRVAGGDGDSDPYVDLRVPTSGEADPLVDLRTALETWRNSHPCDERGPETPSAGANDGCDCHLPRGRTPANVPLGLGALAALAGALRRKRARPDA
jgi:uncharacterized Ntn-hydrolase superfamily protein